MKAVHHLLAAVANFTFDLRGVAPAVLLHSPQFCPRKRGNVGRGSLTKHVLKTKLL